MATRIPHFLLVFFLFQPAESCRLAHGLLVAARVDPIRFDSVSCSFGAPCSVSSAVRFCDRRREGTKPTREESRGGHAGRSFGVRLRSGTKPGPSGVSELVPGVVFVVLCCAFSTAENVPGALPFTRNVMLSLLARSVRCGGANPDRSDGRRRSHLPGGAAPRRVLPRDDGFPETPRREGRQR